MPLRDEISTRSFSLSFSRRRRISNCPQGNISNPSVREDISNLRSKYLELRGKSRAAFYCPLTATTYPPALVPETEKTAFSGSARVAAPSFPAGTKKTE